MATTKTPTKPKAAGAQPGSPAAPDAPADPPTDAAPTTTPAADEPRPIKGGAVYLDPDTGAIGPGHDDPAWVASGNVFPEARALRLTADEARVLGNQSDGARRNWFEGGRSAFQSQGRLPGQHGKGTVGIGPGAEAIPDRPKDVKDDAVVGPDGVPTGATDPLR